MRKSNNIKCFANCGVDARVCCSDLPATHCESVMDKKIQSLIKKSLPLMPCLFRSWYMCLKGRPFLFLFVIFIYTRLTLGHCYKLIWFFTRLFSSAVVSLGFGDPKCSFGGDVNPFTLCCRRPLCGCCCRRALWFQSYPAWETLSHFLPSTEASCGE